MELIDERGPGAQAPEAERRPRWYLLYYLLAALDVITVLASLTLNHRMMQIYVDSVAVNQEWAVRQGKYSELGELAAAVNAPGNDVFDSRNVSGESARLRAALNAFAAEFNAARADVLDNVSASKAAPLLQDFDEIQRAMGEMVGEAERIFGYFETKQADRAGERMATMDRKYASVNRALARLARSVRAIQSSHFEEQVKTAETLKRLEYLIVGLVILMIIGALFYGSRIFKAMQTANAERAAYIEALTRARVEADAANQAKSKFLANMSHEIRTPLNTIFLTLDMLRESDLGAEQKSCLTMAKSSSRSLHRLVNDLLNLSKIESGQIDFERIPFNLHLVLRQILAPFLGRAKAKGVSFAIEIAPDVPEAVEGDPTRIEQVIGNLVDNAVKFTVAGSVKVSVSLRAEERSVAGEPGRGKVPLRIAVHDTGIGLTPEQKSRIFDDFAQADESTTRKYGGTGLGLAIARRLVGLMEGRLGVETRPGGGSTFWFSIDLAAGDPSNLARPLQTSASDQEKSLAGRRVLLVDDAPEGRALFAAMLSQMGMKVDVAADGAEAVSAAAASRYDAILMDIAMPVMDGFEATRRIRERENGDEEVPIIALSAQAMDGILERCLDAGMDDHVAKPFTRDEVVAALNRWVPRGGTRQ